MPDFDVPVPSPFRRTLVQSLVPTRQRTSVTAAETETATKFKALPVDNFKRSAPCPDAPLPVAQGRELVAVEQTTRLTKIETRTRTHWEATSAKDDGLNVNELVASGAFVPKGTRVAIPGSEPDLSRANLVGQKSKVTSADTETATHWDVDGEGEDREATVTAQKTVLTGLETNTKSRWDFRGTHTSLGKLLGER
ncbi:MAG: hypothetical protein JWM80_276 [Cyanobacteria bacterium RYN_339]|nr:hypothetical protein [Cyanobacteria bacterium RYN_339]